MRSFSLPFGRFCVLIELEIGRVVSEEHRTVFVVRGIFEPNGPGEVFGLAPPELVLGGRGVKFPFESGQANDLFRWV